MTFRMKLVNTTNYPTKEMRELVRKYVKLKLPSVHIVVQALADNPGGYLWFERKEGAYQIEIKMPRADDYPYDSYAVINKQWYTRAYKNWRENFVGWVAHELRHVWQLHHAWHVDTTVEYLRIGHENSRSERDAARYGYDRLKAYQKKEQNNERV